MVKDAAAREAEQTEPGTVADVHYDFTQFGLDRSQSAFVKNDLRTSLIVDPPNGKMPPLTAEGQKRAADRAAERRRMGATTDAVQNMPIGTRCIIMAGSGPPMMNAGLQQQLPDRAGPGLRDDSRRDDPRRPHHPARRPPHRCPTNIRQWMGDSRGHWEGDTLVVETTNFNGKNPFRGSSENMHVTERFTRVDADTLSYEFTVDDPSTWATPWTAEAPMTKIGRPDLRARLPRGQLRRDEHARRRAARREEGGRSRREEDLELTERTQGAIACERSMWLPASASACWPMVGQVRAHHAFSAEFDVKKPLTLKGITRQVGDDQSPFLVPHRGEGPGRPGRRVDDRRRQPELADPPGRDEEHLPIGTEVTIEGYAAKDARTRPSAGTSSWRTASGCSSDRRAAPTRRRRPLGAPEVASCWRSGRLQPAVASA